MTLASTLTSPETAVGAPIGVAIGESSIGTVLLAHTRAGVCAVLVGDDADELRRELDRTMPDATGAGDAALLARVIERIEHPAGAGAEVPLDVGGTPFQRDVWHALVDIPSGETTTYAEVARRVGRPYAVRAVASAIAANPVAVLVPCHRVIRSDGSLSGYRWGVERKRVLLEREGAAVA